MSLRQTTAMLSVLAALTLGGCADNDGPAENFGERVDDAMGEARDRLDDAADEAREAADEIGEALRGDN